MINAWQMDSNRSNHSNHINYWRRTVWVLLCSIALMTQVAPQAQAASKDIVCYSAIFPPNVTQDANGLIAGIDVDIVAQAGHRAGLHVEFKLLPSARLEIELKRGAASAIECAFAYTSNDERAAYMDFMRVPLKVTRYLIYTNKNSGIHQLKDFKGKVIGLRRGFIVPGEFEEMRKRQEFTIEEVDDDSSNFSKLALNRIHAIVANGDSGRRVLAQMPQHEILTLAPAVAEAPTFLVLNKAKNLSQWLPALDKSLLEMQQDGSAQKIRDKYSLEGTNKK